MTDIGYFYFYGFGTLQSEYSIPYHMYCTGAGAAALLYVQPTKVTKLHVSKPYYAVYFVRSTALVRRTVHFQYSSDNGTRAQYQQVQ